VCHIDALISNPKILARPVNEVGRVEQSYYRWHKIDGFIKVDQAKRRKDPELEISRL